MSIKHFGIHILHLITGPVYTRRKKNRQAKLVQWAEKQAVVEDKHRSHMDQAENTTLSGEKKKQTTSALFSSDIRSWEESIRLSKT